MIDQTFQFAADHRVQIPEAVNFHEIGVIIRQHEFRIGVEKQVGHVIQMHQAIELR